MGEKEKIRDYLAYGFTEPFRDPLWKHIYLTPGLKRLTAAPAFQKLSGIKQLGPTYMVYPGATHTRLNHSLGVFALARRIIQAIISFDPAGEFTKSGVKAFLCAALLHDLGHFPYAHSLKELPLKAHEVLTAEIILDTPLFGLIERHAQTDPLMVASIIDESKDSCGSAEIDVYRNILSGVLDPDKLDYLSRDAYFCGVPYGVQDVDFVIHKLRYHKTEGLVLDEQGLHAVENVLFSKYLMYRSVYWHKVVRIATAMIKKAVYSGIRDGAVIPSDLYGLDDYEFFSRYSSGSFAYSSLVNDVWQRKLYKVVAEQPFQPGNPDHEKLLDLDTRSAHEKQICESLHIDPSKLILDIPEPVSFEIDLQIDTGGRLVSFTEAGSVFSRDVIKGFTGALRKMRVMAHPDILETIQSSGVLSSWKS